MRALTWHGKHNVKIETAEDLHILDQTEAIVEVTASVWKAVPVGRFAIEWSQTNLCH